MGSISDKQIVPHTTLIRHLTGTGNESHSGHVVLSTPKSNYLAPIAQSITERRINTAVENLRGIQVDITLKRGTHVKELEIATPVTVARKLLTDLASDEFVLVRVLENGSVTGSGVVRYDDADIDDDDKLRDAE